MSRFKKLFLFFLPLSLLTSCVKHQLNPDEQDGTIEFTIDGQVVQGDYAVDATFSGFNLLYTTFYIQAETIDKKRIQLEVIHTKPGMNTAPQQIMGFSYKPNKPKQSKAPDYFSEPGDISNWVNFDILDDSAAKGTFQFRLVDENDPADIQTVNGSFEVVF